MTEMILVSGEGCAGCEAAEPIARKLARERNVAFRRLEAGEKTQEMLARLAIDRLPTLLVVRDGEEIARCCGYQPEEILSLWLDAKLGDTNEKGGVK